MDTRLLWLYPLTVLALFVLFAGTDDALQLLLNIALTLTED